MRARGGLAVISIVAAVFVVAATACSKADSADDRIAPPPPTADGGADADAATELPDPNGGRDTKPASCFAACQNTEFSCATKGGASPIVTNAELLREGDGCVGTLTADRGAANEKVLALKLDCASGDICIATAPGGAPTSCVAGTFSAFSFAYVPTAGGVMNLCTRN
jgi:hypothetical protein